MNENISHLSQSTTNVGDFVEQMKILKKVDKKIGKLKEKATLIGQFCNIIDNHKGNIVLTDKEMPKRVKGYHVALLQNLSALDNAISKVEQNAERHMVRFAEQVSKNLIPNLIKEVDKM